MNLKPETIKRVAEKLGVVERYTNLRKDGYFDPLDPEHVLAMHFMMMKQYRFCETTQTLGGYRIFYYLNGNFDHVEAHGSGATPSEAIVNAFVEFIGGEG